MSNASTVVLRTTELCLSYGKLRAVDQLNMVVREGEIYGFLGRNGAGKTSTIRMLMGMIRPDRGRIELLGYGGRRIGVKQKQRIGYVSQEQFFYSWMTCRGLGRFVSGFYPTWDHAEFDRLLALLDLPPRRKVSHLSGGMRVKLALALALAHRPPILILDEPTSGLDPVARREFLEIIRRQARSHRRTTFFSSHLIDEVERVADRVGIIHNGQLRYEGDIGTLRSSVRRVRFAQARDGAEQSSASNLQQDDSAKANGLDLDGPILAEAVEQADAASLPPGPRTVDHPTGNIDGEINAGSAALAGATTSPHEGTPPVAMDQSLRREYINVAEENGFKVLEGNFENRTSLILFGGPDAWGMGVFPSERVSQLSLEDIFIALAVEATPDL